MPSVEGEADVYVREPLQEVGVAQPERAVVDARALKPAALAAAAAAVVAFEQLAPSRVVVGPLPIPLAAAVRVADPQQPHSLARARRVGLTNVEYRVGVPADEAHLIEVGLLRRLGAASHRQSERAVRSQSGPRGHRVEAAG